VTPWAMDESPSSMRVGGLLFREAVESNIVVLQSFRNDPGVNRFVVRIAAEKRRGPRTRCGRRSRR